MKIEELIKTYKTISNISKAVSGKKVKIIDNTRSGHGLLPGSYGTIIKYNGSPQAPYYGSFTVSGELGTGAPWTVYGTELKFSGDTKEEIENEISEINKTIITLNKEIDQLKAKLVFMKEQKLEVFDENTFKAFQTLSLLDNKKLSKIEKAKLISDLIGK